MAIPTSWSAGFQADDRACVRRTGGPLNDFSEWRQVWFSMPGQAAPDADHRNAHGARLLQFVGFPAAEALVGLLLTGNGPRRDHAAGISRTVYCVNIDAVIAALLLKILWKSYRAGAASRQALEIAAFTLFLHARMIGSAAEIDD